ncbi:MAG: hypothetical protein AAGC64_11005 [Bacteroidota bacterium]
MKNLLAIILMFVVLCLVYRQSPVSTYVDKIETVAKTDISVEAVNIYETEYEDFGQKAKILKSIRVLDKNFS